jgi:hypothetical protein
MLNEASLSKVLQRLSEERPVFHSEADLQHALAWSIQRAFPSARVRLEMRAPGIAERLHLDAWFQIDAERTALEIKYKSHRLQTTVNGESFDLLGHGAQDLGRYDFLKDVQRLERVCDGGAAERGFAIMITNDPAYWTTRGSSVGSACESYRLTPGREVSGSLQWGANAGPGTTRGRELPIVLRRRYLLHWQAFSVVVPGVRGGEFRSLIVPVGGRTIAR